MALVGAQFVNAVSPNPVGSLQAYAGASAPTGWLLCDGSQQEISTYPELYSVLGTTYGSLTNGSGGAGSTHFRVPDLRGRMPIGAGNDGTAANNATRTRGATGGDTRLQSHSHTGATGFMNSNNVHQPYVNSPGGHSWGANFGGLSGTATFTFSPSGVFAGMYGGTPLRTDAFDVNHTHNFTTNDHNQAVGSAANMPPFLVTNYIIKAVPDAPRSGLAYGSTPPIASTFPANPQFGEVVSFSINNGTQLVPCQWTGSRWCALVGGGPIQVVQVVKTDAMAAAPNALWGDIPGLAATITPIFNTSKVLVTVDLKGAGAQSSSVMSVRLLRDSTPVFIGDAASNRRRAMSQEYNGNISGDSNFAMAQMGGTFLDSPATTSAITYKVQFGGDSSGSVLYVNRTQGDRDNANMDARGASSITLMEMAA